MVPSCDTGTLALRTHALLRRDVDTPAAFIKGRRNTDRAVIVKGSPSAWIPGAPAERGHKAVPPP